ncbi:hypothetical protein P029_00530 [Anaplasma phagocytophilum str. Norway variant2]|uniref:Uncharacterized protein n=1 Tax=Anaplasma phagocytophilum str. Norway variant2 TaxID=1392507 RepID=A0A161I2Z6_ANAPH|nr:hypothetical protein P029_00530 [Anaplasma phagocytophilum str. Norway variant2]
MEISAPKIEKKVCVTKNQSGAGSSNHYAATTNNQSGSNSNKDVAVCGAGTASTGAGGGSETAQTLKNFAEKTLLGNESKNWPTSTAGTHQDPKPETNDNAKAVAGDLTKLTSDEKTIVAGLLAKTIEGGEVVEIRAVSSTFTKT